MMSSNNDYTPAKIWKWEKPSGERDWRYAAVNRPIAGPTHDAELPVGRHPLQLIRAQCPTA